MSYSIPSPYLYKACVLCKRTVLLSDLQEEEEKEELERTNHSKYYPLEIECHILTLSVHLYRRIRICLLHF